ncbi:unnamed protein product [Dovyalis caffra]|uniref:Protein CROWDED NUCLEI 4-like n=1 Tax=Dovyalis caffra TaxID=77055 RepID=A0AAV1QTB4_9ROSI|nr:unnamed protein product [Dovyalis caffra]
MTSPITPSNGSGRALSLTPGATVLKTPLSEETIWKRLKDAGFDEESVKRRDKAALIAYIAKLEAEMIDLQYYMGLLVLEKKEWTSKYEQMKASAETADLMRRHDQAAHLSALAEAKKREESLKKALGVEKECISSMEKALHEMRTESAEIKVAADSQLAEARNMVQDAQKKFLDAEAKMHAAEALQAEASRFHRAAERKLQEVEAREADLSRRMTAFKTDCDGKEKEIGLERQSLSERRKVLQQEQERLLDGQSLLNQREDYVASKSQELNQLEKDLEASKANIEKERRALNDEKSNLELTIASLSQREEAVIEREAVLSKREQELLVLQEKIASKESVEIQKAVANHENVLRTRNSEFEAELDLKRKLVEDEIEAKRRAWELREVDLKQREDLVLEKEHDLEIQSRALGDKEKDVTDKINFLDDKERSLSVIENDIELRRALLLQEREEINKTKLDLQKSLDSLEDERKQVDYAKEKLQTLTSETNELAALEMNLKEEVDTLRAQKLELMTEENRLKLEKAKFETEWELIDEKREELRKEAERVAEEREAVSRLLKDERDSLRLEKKSIQDQQKQDVESLNREREEFMNKMEHERSEWFNRIQKEHADFLLGIEMQKRELESSIEKRREEIESYLSDKEKAFELEKKTELQHIASLREKAEKELEQAALEMKKLDAERMEINVDRERRDGEWAMLNKSIEELRGQTQKLEKQRQLLHGEREEISVQIEQLKKLDDLKLALDDMELEEMQQSNMDSSRQKISAIRRLKQQDIGQDTANILGGLNSPTLKTDVASTPNSARFSWIKRCTELIFKNSPERPLSKSEESGMSGHEYATLKTGKLDSSNGYCGQKHKSVEIFDKSQPIRYAYGEPKVILEVPPEGEITKEACGVEYDIAELANERITHPISDLALQAGRKRRVDNSSLDDSVDFQPGKSRSNKKRRQKEIASANLPEDTINDIVTSTQEVVCKDQDAAEDADVLMIDKIIKVSEVTCEITDDTFANQEKTVRLQNSEKTSKHNTGTSGEVS